jgi:glycosyltransferase involved in cell wall biosynthesis
MPPALDIEKSTRFDRRYFKLPENQFTFLFVFDFKSCFARKNPLGCIQAFQNAFSNANEGVGLVIKSMDGDQYPNEFKLLNAAVQSDPRITIINTTYTSDEIIGLMDVCDAFVSLHRSEGIGLSIAQSMLLGKPVIATNYSGNKDFTRPDNSCLVDYKLIEVKKDEYPLSKGQVWADPNVDQAANYMRRLVEDDSYRNTVAEAGRLYIRTNHNSEIVGRNYLSRLVELGLLDG